MENDEAVEIALKAFGAGYAMAAADVSKVMCQGKPLMERMGDLVEFLGREDLVDRKIDQFTATLREIHGI